MSYILMLLGAGPTQAATAGITITTNASPSVVLGGQISDTAVLTNVTGPTGTITFTLYGPNDPRCISSPAFPPSVVDVSPTASSFTSATFTPTVAGVYNWGAVFRDANGTLIATSSCGAANESVMVTPPGPAALTITTTATSAAPVGGPISDTATLTGGSNPTGTITFTLFNSAGCTGTPLFTATVPVAGAASYPSGPFTTGASGTYQWVAAYSGDANNKPAISPCGAAGETTTVGDGGPGTSPIALTHPPTVISSSSARFTATINPQGLASTMHFEYRVDLPGVGVAAVVYDARTPEQPVGADFADHTVTATVAGLLPNSRYHVRAVATNAAGVTPGADAVFHTAADRPPPPPVLGKTVNATPVNGIVYVLLPGAGHVARARPAAAKGVGFIALTEARQLPLGTVFDTTHGVARLTNATGKRGVVQSGDFGAGLFKVLQNRRERGLTELALVVGSGAASTCATAGKKVRTAARRALPKTVLAMLRATVRGRYRTRGRFSSATVRGTIWTTTDRCDGTLTAVKRGVVVVSDFRRRRQVVVAAGRSYLAKAP